MTRSGLAQTTNFDPLVGYFSLGRAKNNLQKKKGTMLPFVLSLSKPRPEAPLSLSKGRDEGGRLKALLRKFYLYISM